MKTLSFKSMFSGIISICLILFLNFGFGQTTVFEDKKISTIKGDGYRTVEDIDGFIITQMDSLQIPGLSIAIIENNKVVYYRTFGYKNIETKEKVGDSTLFEAASMTKPVFVYAVMKLVEKGELNLDTPLYKYYPYDDIDHDERYKLITARMILSHTSGDSQLITPRHIDTVGTGSKFSSGGISTEI